MSVMPPVPHSKTALLRFSAAVAVITAHCSGLAAQRRLHRMSRMRLAAEFSVMLFLSPWPGSVR